MDFQEELLEPIKYYKYELEYKHNDNVNIFFDELTQKAGTDTEANKQTCKEYYEADTAARKLEKKLNTNQGLRIFLIVLTIIFFAVGTILSIVSILQKVDIRIFLPIGLTLIAAGIAFIVINIKVLGKRIAKLKEKIKQLRIIAEKAKALANEQMASLNALYDWNIPSTLMSKTAPIIQMDKNLTVERCAHLSENYGWKDTNPDNVSAIFVQSGTIVGNPFLYERDYVQQMYDKAYTGTLVIHWTTLATDGKGHTRTVHHSQTLVATITKPAAKYFLDTALIYGNEAAPQLSFSRKPSNANNMKEKDIERESARFDQKLQKMQEKKVGSSFTALGNSKFEYLFNALDRNNEVEFRLLFTPLAQKNMIEVITSKTPYGDDFRFVKRNMINVIHSTHGQTLDFDGNPYHFLHFDYEKARDNFINYNENYFRGIYYDFVPLLSIPLYQQHKDFDVHGSPKYKGNISLYEAEILSNFMDDNIFKPDDCDTHIVLKSSLLSSNKYFDVFNIKAHGFHMDPRVEIVPKVGGDGLTHGVPVHWFEYIPVEKDSSVVVMNVGGTRQIYNRNKARINEIISNYSKSSDIIYQRGLLAFPLKEGVSSIDGEKIKQFFSQKED